MSDENKTFEEPEEEMTVTLETDDGKTTECAVLTIFEVSDQDYIALMPVEDLENEDEESEGTVWFYRYSENPDDPNEEPELSDIEDDDEFEAVIDAFDEYLDNLEFDEM